VVAGSCEPQESLHVVPASTLLAHEERESREVRERFEKNMAG